MRYITKTTREFVMATLYGKVTCMCDLDITDKVTIAPKDENNYRYYYNDFDGSKTVKTIADEYVLNDHFIIALHPKKDVVEQIKVRVLYCNPCGYYRGRGYKRGMFAGRNNHYYEVNIVIYFKNRTDVETIRCHQIKNADNNIALAQLRDYFVEYFGWDLLETNKETNLRVFKAITQACSESQYKNTTLYTLGRMLGDFDMAIEKACNKLVQAGFITEETRKSSKGDFKVYKVAQKGIERLNQVNGGN